MSLTVNNYCALPYSMYSLTLAHDRFNIYVKYSKIPKNQTIPKSTLPKSTYTKFKAAETTKTKPVFWQRRRKKGRTARQAGLSKNFYQQRKAKPVNGFYFGLLRLANLSRGSDAPPPLHPSISEHHLICRLTTFLIFCARISFKQAWIMTSWSFVSRFFFF